MKKDTIVLPDGIKITERTKEIELAGRGKEKYLPIIGALKTLTGTNCVQIDTTGLSLGQLKSYKAGLRNTARELGVKGKMKFSDKTNVLYVWING